MNEWLRYEANRKSRGVKEEDIMKEAEELYPYPDENLVAVDWPTIRMVVGMERAAHIKSAQLHCNDGLDKLIEWVTDTSQNFKYNYPYPDQVVTKANEIKSLNK